MSSFLLYLLFCPLIVLSLLALFCHLGLTFSVYLLTLPPLRSSLSLGWSLSGLESLQFGVWLHGALGAGFLQEEERKEDGSLDKAEWPKAVGAWSQQS